MSDQAPGNGMPAPAPPIARIVIELTESGQVQFNSSLSNVFMALGLLEMAKAALLRRTANGEPSRIVPARVLPPS